MVASGEINAGQPMNWRRGLLRTWLVVSICWVGVVGGQGVYEWYDDSWRNVPERPANCDPKNPFTKYVPECLEMAPWLKTYPFWAALRLAIGPPAALLLLGAALYWVGQGFRERT
jgi:hypothetical protein